MSKHLSNSSGEQGHALVYGGETDHTLELLCQSSDYGIHINTNGDMVKLEVTTGLKKIVAIALPVVVFTQFADAVRAEIEANPPLGSPLSPSPCIPSFSPPYNPPSDAFASLSCPPPVLGPTDLRSSVSDIKINAREASRHIEGMPLTGKGDTLNLFGDGTTEPAKKTPTRRKQSSEPKPPKLPKDGAFMIASYYETFKAIYGKNAILSPADRANLMWVGKELKEENAHNALRNFFNSHTPYLDSKQHPVGAFKAGINVYVDGIEVWKNGRTTKTSIPKGDPSINDIAKDVYENMDADVAAMYES